MIEFFIKNAEPLAIGIAYFTLFALFHSITAQYWFKEWLARCFSQFFVDHFWRLIYCLISIELYFVLTIPYINSNVENVTLITLSPEVQATIGNIALIGFALFTLVLVEMDFLYYFGLKQATRGILVLCKIIKPEQWEVSYTLKTSFLYRMVRHPLYFSLMLMLLPAIDNAIGITLYILYFIYLAIGLPVEERKLIKQFGQSYVDYRKRTPAIIPFAKLQWWRSLADA